MVISSWTANCRVRHCGPEVRKASLQQKSLQQVLKLVLDAGTKSKLVYVAPPSSLHGLGFRDSRCSLIMHSVKVFLRTRSLQRVSVLVLTKRGSYLLLEVCCPLVNPRCVKNQSII